MGRLIVADTLSEHKFQEVEFHGGSLNAAYRQGWNDAIDAIVENEPPVDAVPVRHGHWKEDPSGYGFWICSACGFVSEASAANILYKFCPNCGEDMRKDGDGNG